MNVPDTFRQFIKQLIRWKKGWIRNTGKMAKSFYAKSLPAVFYNYAMLILSYTLPFSVVFSLAVQYVWFGKYPWMFLGFALLLATICAAHQKFTESSESWKYRILSSLFFLLIYPMLTFYALCKVKDSSWGTR